MRIYLVFAALIFCMSSYSQEFRPYIVVGASTGSSAASDGAIKPSASVGVGTEMKLFGNLGLNVSAEYSKYFTNSSELLLSSIRPRVSVSLQRDSASKFVYFLGWSRNQFSLRSKSQTIGQIELQESKSQWVQQFSFYGVKYRFNSFNSIGIELNYHYRLRYIPALTKGWSTISLFYVHSFKPMKSKGLASNWRRLTSYVELKAGNEMVVSQTAKDRKSGVYSLGYGIRIKLGTITSFFINNGIRFNPSNATVQAHRIRYLGELGLEISPDVAGGFMMPIRFGYGLTNYQISELDSDPSHFKLIRAQKIFIEVGMLVGKRFPVSLGVMRTSFGFDPIERDYQRVSSSTITPYIGVRCFLGKTVRVERS
jgi:hypothetical protein